jgi:predicted O-linked N-acetylglucosamine transferase (SPINDLY family)/GR25 family glycosyltransferase involved in LPS biosynthesis/glycosyltransferase involved in cell wall biosynthesis
MKILFCSYHPLAASGYSNQAFYICKKLIESGHEIAFFLVNTPIPSKIQQQLTYDEVLNEMNKSYIKDIHKDKTDIARQFTYYANPYEKFPSLIETKYINYLINDYNADIVICYFDLYILDGSKFVVPSICYIPVHYEPISIETNKAIHLFDHCVSMSQYGVNSINKIIDSSIPVSYIPHVMDSNYFKNKYALSNYDEYKSKLRLKYGVPSNSYLCLMVANNADSSDRKAFDVNVLAFKKLLDKKKDAMIYIHTQVIKGSIDLPVLIANAGIPAQCIRYADQEKYVNKKYTTEDMVELYVMSDVLLSASKTEGFGIPIMESQMCGTPVITNDCTAMTEITFFGKCVEPLQMGYNPNFNSYWYIPSVQGVYDALIEIYGWNDNMRRKLMNKYRNKINNFNYNNVIGKWIDCIENVKLTNVETLNKTNINFQLGKFALYNKNPLFAIKCFNKILRLDNKHVLSYQNLALACREINKLEDTDRLLTKAIQLEPTKLELYMIRALSSPTLYKNTDEIKHWRNKIEIYLDEIINNTFDTTIDDPIKDLSTSLWQFFMSFHNINNTTIYNKISKAYIKICPNLLYVSPYIDEIIDTKKNRPKIKIGFISKYFKKYSANKLIHGIIMNMDIKRFDIHLFSRVDKDDENTNDLFNKVGQNRYITINNKNLAQLQQCIGDCKLDILVYVDIGMEPNSYFLAYSRLAPVQCVIPGHYMTSGIPTIDKFITFDMFESDNAEQFYTEELIKLKNFVYYYNPRENVNITAEYSNKLRYGLPQDKHLYYCQQNYFKLHPIMFTIFKQITHKDPLAIIVFREETGLGINDLLESQLKELSINNYCIIKRDLLTSHDEWMNFIGLADIILDTYPFGGFTTTAEALTMDIPIITLMDELMTSRFTYGFYKYIGINENKLIKQYCINDNINDYIINAIKLVNNYNDMKSVKTTIRNNINNLFNRKSAVTEWENCFEELVQTTHTCITQQILKINFVDFWGYFNKEYNFFTNLLRHYYNKQSIIIRIDEHNPDLIFYSAFGNQHTKYNCPKIFFTGENIRPDTNADYSLGFDYSNNNNYTRLPLWILYINWFCVNYPNGCQRSPIDQSLSYLKNNNNNQNRNRFCCFVVTNKNNPIRNNLFHELNLYKTVDSAGELYNSIGSVLPRDEDSSDGLTKIHFLQNYKFCIAYESSSYPGYVTEKILHAKMAGCIPIYWGDTEIIKQFNPDSFINAHDYDSNQGVINRIREIDNDSELYNKMQNESLFYPTTRDDHRVLFNTVFDNINKLLSSPVNNIQTDKNVTYNCQINDRVLVLCCNSKYYSNCLTLLNSYKKYNGTQIVDSIIIYNLGLTTDQMFNLLKLDDFNIRIINFPNDIKNIYDGYLEPNNYAWKLYILNDAKRFAKYIFYLDCGACFMKQFDDIYNIIETDDILLVKDVTQINKDWCHGKSIKIMEITDIELNSHQLCSGIIGYSSVGKYSQLFEDAFNYSKIKECIIGSKLNHRQDQTIMSILYLRYKCPTQDLYKYGEWRSFNHAVKNNSIIYVHRGAFTNHDLLKIPNSKEQPIEYYLQEGCKNMQQKNIQKALDIYKMGLNIYPTDMRILANIAAISFNMNDYINSALYYEQALGFTNKSDSNGILYNGYANTLIRLHKYNKAEQYLILSMKECPHYTKSFITYSFILLLQGYKSLENIINSINLAMDVINKDGSLLQYNMTHEFFKLCINRQLLEQITENGNQGIKLGVEYHKINKYIIERQNEVNYDVKALIQEHDLKIGVEQVFVLNMESRPEHWEHMQSIFNMLQLRRFNAIEGTYLNKSDYSSIILNINEWKHGEIGCCLSHMKMWQTIVEENISSVLIMEDDVDCDEHFKQRFSAYMDDLNKIDSDWDIVYVTGTISKLRDEYKQAMHNVGTHLYKIHNNRIDLYDLGTVSYAISKKGAAKYLNLIKQGITQKIDFFMFNVDSDKVNKYCFKKPLIHHNGFISDTQGI